MYVYTCAYMPVHDTIDKSEIFVDHLLCGTLFTSEIEAVVLCAFRGTHQRNRKASKTTRTHATHTHTRTHILHCPVNQFIISRILFHSVLVSSFSLSLRSQPFTFLISFCFVQLDEFVHKMLIWLSHGSIGNLTSRKSAWNVFDMFTVVVRTHKMVCGVMFMSDYLQVSRRNSSLRTWYTFIPFVLNRIASHSSIVSHGIFIQLIASEVHRCGYIPRCKTIFYLELWVIVMVMMMVMVMIALTLNQIIISISCA